MYIIDIINTATKESVGLAQNVRIAEDSVRISHSRLPNVTFTRVEDRMHVLSNGGDFTFEFRMREVMDTPDHL